MVPAAGGDFDPVGAGSGIKVPDLRVIIAFPGKGAGVIAGNISGVVDGGGDHSGGKPGILPACIVRIALQKGLQGHFFIVGVWAGHIRRQNRNRAEEQGKRKNEAQKRLLNGLHFDALFSDEESIVFWKSSSCLYYNSFFNGFQAAS